jgi:hypothetical protein
MKKTQVIARVLAWFNLVFWGVGLVNSLFSPLMNLAIMVVLVSIPLSSFAALQLHKSIRNPEVKLSHQTPVGIRFVGIIALLIGIGLAGIGIILAQYARELLPSWIEQSAAMKDPPPFNTVGGLQVAGAFLALLGFAVIFGVVLNMRLLRWYYLVKQSGVS